MVLFHTLMKKVQNVTNIIMPKIESGFSSGQETYKEEIELQLVKINNITIYTSANKTF